MRYVCESLAMDTRDSNTQRERATTLRTGFKSKDPGVFSVLAEASANNRLVRVPGYDFSITNLADEPDGAFKKEIREAFPEVDLDSYHLSSKIKGEATVAKLRRLIHSQACEAERRVDEKTFICHWVLSIAQQITYDGKGGVLRTRPLPMESIPFIKLKDSSVGYANPAFNLSRRKIQSKREEAVSVRMQIEISERAGIVPMNVTKAAKKLEVIEKVSKKAKAKGEKDQPKAMRYIYCCNTMEFVSFYASGFYDLMAHGQNTHDARLLPSGPGSYYELVQILSRSLPDDASFKQREDSLGEKVFTCDFRGWEYKLGLYNKTMYFLGAVPTVTEIKYPYSLTGAVASVLCPIVGIEGELAIVAYDALPSGTLPTYDMNSTQNNFMTKDFANTVPEGSRAEILDTIKGGDDLVSRWHSKVDDMLSHYEGKFGMEVAEVGENCFLQRKVDFKNQRMVYPFERALNKIYHSPGSAEDKRQQVYSFYLISGGDFDKYAKLREIVGKPETFFDKADGDLMGFYNGGLDDDMAVIQYHEPVDPNEIKMKFAFETVHNNSKSHMQRRIDVEGGRLLFIRKYRRYMKKLLR